MTCCGRSIPPGSRPPSRSWSRSARGTPRPARPTRCAAYLTTLTWEANPEADLVGYQVVMRETTAADWTDAIDVGNVATVTLDIAKDNFQFGIRAVDQAGHRSPAAFPQAVA